jgi:hypothetical protein
MDILPSNPSLCKLTRAQLLLYGNVSRRSGGWKLRLEYLSLFNIIAHLLQVFNKGCYRRKIARVTVRPSLLGDGVSAFPFDTKGALVYNSYMAESVDGVERARRLRKTDPCMS